MGNDKKQHVVVANGITTVNLKHPIKFNDVDIKEVKMDFNKVTGGVLCSAETEAQSRYYNQSADIEFGKAYQASVAGKVSELPYDAILELRLIDFQVIVDVVKGFLLP